MGRRRREEERQIETIAGAFPSASTSGRRASSPATFINDTFTDTDAVLLVNHTAELGGPWTVQTGTGAATVQTNRIFCATSTVTVQATAVSPTTDYYVEAVVDLITDAADNIGICGRMALDASANYYLLRYAQSSDTWALFAMVAGVATQIGANFSDNWTTGSRTVRLDMVGPTIRAIIGGTERISVVDTTFCIAGKSGIRWAAVQTSATGRHVTSFTAVG